MGTVVRHQPQQHQVESSTNPAGVFFRVASSPWRCRVPFQNPSSHAELCRLGVLLFSLVNSPLIGPCRRPCESTPLCRVLPVAREHVVILLHFLLLLWSLGSRNLLVVLLIDMSLVGGTNHSAGHGAEWVQCRQAAGQRSMQSLLGTYAIAHATETVSVVVNALAESLTNRSLCRHSHAQGRAYGIHGLTDSPGDGLGEAKGCGVYDVRDEINRRFHVSVPEAVPLALLSRLPIIGIRIT